eukprot:gnl/MRDRNA2_/MRDRNA2_143389_c0_seq1.p1 gnl/MRDRNA2_/MRDRNA2_143389_c0~~gnl/MRDRNA2_/MRDRNA2_143389_c0_seq1.p1  ORF type:complete len:202 (+),score=27.67 gnl/MRDRNA2_/MRDRNA2_143389_c0_seq1:78-608(+)
MAALISTLKALELPGQMPNECPEPGMAEFRCPFLPPAEMPGACDAQSLVRRTAGLAPGLLLSLRHFESAVLDVTDFTLKYFVDTVRVDVVDAVDPLLTSLDCHFIQQHSVAASDAVCGRVFSGMYWIAIAQYGLGFATLTMVACEYFFWRHLKKFNRTISDRNGAASEMEMVELTS